MSANDQHSPANSLDIKLFSTVGWAAAGYLLLALLYTWPLVLALPTRTPFLGLNHVLFANADLIGEQLARFELPLTVPRIFYPTGYTLHEGLLPSVMAWLLGFGRNPVLGLNLSILLSYVLAGLGVFLLALQFTRSRAGAFFAGVYFSFSAFHFANLGVYPIRHVEWLVWFLFALIAHGRTPRAAYLVLLAVSFIAASLSSWYYAVFCGLIFTLHALIVVGAERSLARVLRPALVLAVCCLLLLPLSPPVLLGADGVATGGRQQVIDLSADLLSFVTPSSRHWYFGEQIRGWQQSWPGNPGLRANYLGTLSLLLALGGMFFGSGRDRRLRIFYAGLALVATILALGPYLAVGGLDGWSVGAAHEPDSIRLPYYWLADLFPFSATRATSRFALLTLLATAVFLAAGYRLLEVRARRRWQKIALPALLALVLGLELWPVWPLALKAPLPVTDFHAGLSAESGDFSVLELPYDIRSYRILYDAAAHDKKVVGGSVDKPFRRFARTLERYPYFPLLLRTSNTGAVAPHVASDVFGEHAAAYTEGVLNALRVRYAVIHLWAEHTLSYGPYFVEEKRAPALADAVALHFEPHSEEKLVEVYRREVGEKWLFPVLGPEWGRVQDHRTHVMRALEGAAGTIEIVSDAATRIDVELGLSVIRVPERLVTVSLDGREVFDATLPRRKNAQELRLVRLPGLQLEAGVNVLEIATPEVDVAADPDAFQVTLLLGSIGLVEETDDDLATAPQASSSQSQK